MRNARTAVVLRIAEFIAFLSASVQTHIFMRDCTTLESKATRKTSAALGASKLVGRAAMLVRQSRSVSKEESTLAA